jgi:hypothetical protein
MGRREMNTIFLFENLKGTNYLEDLSVDGKMKIGCEGVDRMHLAQYSVQWRALMNTVMSLRVSK